MLQMQSDFFAITKKMVYGFLLILATVVAKAQDPYGISLPHIIPPNPSSQEFQKHLGYPVSPATGLVDVSIPLYNLQLPGLSIPFSLKYHSSGIKVEQAYGCIGYGWTMFPQFKITRTVMGKPDEFYRTDNPMEAPTTTLNDYNSYIVDIAPSADGSSNNGGGTVNDGQFDIFSISLPNYNGNFILKRNGNVFTSVSIPDAPLQITVTDTYLRSFEVKDDKGIRYIFNDLAGGVPIADWMLTQVILPGVNNTITLQYTIGGGQALFLSNYSLNVYDDYVFESQSEAIESFHSVMGISNATVDNYSAWKYDATPSMGGASTYYLKSLQFSTGSIELTYGGAGYPNFNELQNLKVYNTAHEALKTITFTQSDNHQLLQKVAISGEGEYNLEYNPGRFQYVFDQDRWGYYNNPGNNATNTSFIPQLSLNVRHNSQSVSSTYPQQFGYANQQTDATAMKANSLEKITYPTGGWSRFYYEPNKFIHDWVDPYGYVPTNGAGLRIKQIDTYDPLSSKTITKTYKYGANESGLGNLVFYPEDDSFIEEAFIYSRGENFGGHRCRRRTITPHSRFRYYNLNFPVWYDQVTEYSDGGKTMYYYNYTPDAIELVYNYGLGLDIGGITVYTEHNVDILQQLNNLAVGGPMLMQKQVYKAENNTYTLLQQEENLYTLSSTQPPIKGLIVIPKGYIYANGAVNNMYWWWPGAIPTNFSGFFGGERLMPFIVKSYQIQPGINNLSSTTRKEYSNGQLFSSTTTNVYDSLYPYNLVSTSTTASDGATLSQKFYYPTSASIPDLNGTQQTMVNTLKSNNRLTTVVEKTSFKNSTLLNGAIYQYKDWGNGILLPEQVYTKNGSNAYESRLHFYGYDNKANVISVSKENDIKSAYIWGYNQTYPIAQVAGAEVKDIFHTSFEDSEGNSIDGESKTGKKSRKGGYSKALTGLTNGSYFLSYWQKNTNIWALQKNVIIVSGNAYTISLSGQVDEVRFYPTTAQMITYTYDPLIGATSQCDANNRITYYEYDASNRVTLIRDQDKNIVKRFCYNYWGQAEDCNYYYNVAKNGNFTRSNCGNGYTGSTVTYTVPAAKYSSTASQTAADQLAQNDVTANGQAYADSVGTCTASFGDIYASNFTSMTFYPVTFYNTSTNVTYTFNINPNQGSTTYVGQIPSGIYNVTIAPSYGSNLYEWWATDASWGYYAGYNTLTLNGISISGNGFNVTIQDY
jgi:hypothetical protein